MSNNTRKVSTRTLVELALLTAIIVVMSFTPIGYLKTPIVEITFITIPVVVGAILVGPAAGAFLGGVFGLTSFIQCFGMSQFGAMLLSINPFLTFIICFVPRILCGVVPYYVSKWISGSSGELNARRRVSFLAAGTAGSLTNTLLVMSMIYIFFGHEYAAAKSLAYEAVFGVVLSVVGINGTIEAVIAALIAAAAASVILHIAAVKRKK